MHLRSACIAAVLALVVRFAFAAEAEIRCVGTDPESGTSAAVIVGPCALLYGPQRSLQKNQTPLDMLRAMVDRDFGPQLHSIVKLNAYLADIAMRPQVDAAIAKYFAGDHKPAVSYVTMPLEFFNSSFVMDAVGVMNCSEREANEWYQTHIHGFHPPHWTRVYVSGQSEKGINVVDALDATLESLSSTLKFLKLSRSQVVQVRDFTKPLDWRAPDENIQQLLANDSLRPGLRQRIIRGLGDPYFDFFGDDLQCALHHIKWQSPYPVEIEMLAAIPDDSMSSERPSLEYLTPPGTKPSPVFSRVVRVNDPRTIYLSSIYADDPTSEPKEQVRQIFQKMAKVLESAGSDMRHLAKATYFVTNDEVGKALNEVRSEFYDPQRAPAASKAMVRGVGRAGHSIAVDMIAVPAR